MQVNIITFGQIAELSSSQIILENVSDTDSLRLRLLEEYPSLININFAIAIDKKVVSENKLINETSTIALLPPFSGG